jgi:hypothetical protein
MNFTLSQEKISEIKRSLTGKRGKTRRIVLNTIVGLLNAHGNASPGQTYLAGQAKRRRRETGNRTVKRLCELGIIIKKYRHEETCLYFLSPSFFQYRHLFYELVPALRQLGLLLLFSLTSNVFAKEVTQLKNINYNSRKREISLLTFRANEANGYNFYDKDYGKLITIQVINKKQSITIEKQQLCPKESVMNQQTIINVIAQAYNLSIEQQELLSRHSFEALEYARKELYRQKKQYSLSNAQSATSWFSAVANSFEKKASRSSNGKMPAYSTKPMNPGGHSPAGDASNLSNDERIQFAMNEESAWEEITETTPIMESVGLHLGYVDRAKSNWKRIGQIPKEFPTSSNAFKNDLSEAEKYTEGPEYEEHLNAISEDKPDPAGYKRRIRITDYRRIARK